MNVTFKVILLRQNIFSKEKNPRRRKTNRSFVPCTKSKIGMVKFENNYIIEFYCLFFYTVLQIDK